MDDISFPIALSALKNVALLAAVTWVLVELLFRDAGDWLGRLLKIRIPTRLVVWIVLAALYVAAHAVDTPLTWSLVLSLLLSSVILAWRTSEVDQQLLKRLVERYFGKTDQTGGAPTTYGTPGDQPVGTGEAGAVKIKPLLIGAIALVLLVLFLSLAT